MKADGLLHDRSFHATGQLLYFANGLVVYRNQHGTGFQDVAGQIGLGIDPVDLTLADVDGNTDLDVVSVTGGALSIFDNDDGSFGKVFSTKIQLGKAVAALLANPGDPLDQGSLGGREALVGNGNAAQGSEDEDQLAGREHVQVHVPS